MLYLVLTRTRSTNPEHLYDYLLVAPGQLDDGHEPLQFYVFPDDVAIPITSFRSTGDGCAWCKQHGQKILALTKLKDGRTRFSIKANAPDKMLCGILVAIARLVETPHLTLKQNP